MNSFIKNVIYVKGTNKVAGFEKACEKIDLKIPTSYKTTTITDLVIFIKTYNEDSSVIAYASICKLNSS